MGKYLTWGYLPHEDRYNRPTIDGRAAAVIRRGGDYAMPGKYRPIRAGGSRSHAREDTARALVR